MTGYRTDGDGLYLNTALNVCVDRVVLLDTGQDTLAAECVDKRGATLAPLVS
jgi:hypothetical protein